MKFHFNISGLVFIILIIIFFYFAHPTGQFHSSHHFSYQYPNKPQSQAKPQNQPQNSGTYQNQQQMQQQFPPQNQYQNEGLQTPQTQERITNYDSKITVLKNGNLNVIETITVYANDKIIKHGIYRDFPTIYFNKYGGTTNVNFQLNYVLKNNNPEQYKIIGIQNGERIQIGNPNLLVSPGIITYQMSYSVSRELGFFDKYDELYWNVTGNGWAFDIDSAKATISLPEGASVLQYSGYVGYTGEKKQDFKTTIINPNTIQFETTRPLLPKEGLTIAVAWPKGFVTEPSASDKISYIINDNFIIIFSIIGVLGILIYYIVAWLHLNGHLRKEPIIPLYYPPPGISPASALFIRKKFFFINMRRALASGIVDLAVNGKLRIKEENKKIILEKKDETTNNIEPGKEKQQIYPEEKIMYDLLFLQNNSYELTQENRKSMGKIITTFNDIILDNAAKYFKNNGKYTVYGFIASALIFFVVYHLAFNPSYARDSLASFSIFFVFAALIILNGFFSGALKSPTEEGRKIIDQIDGFMMFLTATETERYKILNAPNVTPEIFDKYLPYAVAFGVEKEWAKSLLKESYSPDWYKTDAPLQSGAIFAVPALTSSLFSSISQASPPGSSSGSGGGGSSGGGGGGGGGGGW